MTHNEDATHAAACTACRPLWLDGVMSADYEVDTLPLLFAHDSVYEVYYAALAHKHPQWSADLLALQRANSDARAALVMPDVEKCLEALKRCLSMRKSIFKDGSYQHYAALVHYLWTVLFFASDRLHSGALPHAFSLFVTARSELTTWASALCPADHLLLGCVLHGNWATYWWRRGRPSVAVQCCLRALQSWRSLANPSATPLTSLGPFLLCRLAAALLLARRAEVALPKLEALVLAFADSPVDPWSPPSPAGQEADREPVTFGSNVSVLPLGDPSGTFGCCLQTVKVTLTPIPPPPRRIPLHATDWPLWDAVRYVTWYNAGCALLWLHQHAKARAALERAAAVFNECHSQARTPGNPHWWDLLRGAYDHVRGLPPEKTAASFRLRADDLWDRELRWYQAAVRRAVSRRRRGASQSPDPRNEGTDSEAEEASAAWRMLLPVLQRQGKLSPSMAVKYLKHHQQDIWLAQPSLRTVAANSSHRRRKGLRSIHYLSTGTEDFLEDRDSHPAIQDHSTPALRTGSSTKGDFVAQTMSAPISASDEPPPLPAIPQYSSHFVPPAPLAIALADSVVFASDGCFRRQVTEGGAMQLEANIFSEVEILLDDLITTVAARLESAHNVFSWRREASYYDEVCPSSPNRLYPTEVVYFGEQSYTHTSTPQTAEREDVVDTAFAPPPPGALPGAPEADAAVNLEDNRGFLPSASSPPVGAVNTPAQPPRPHKTPSRRLPEKPSPALEPALRAQRQRLVALLQFLDPNTDQYRATLTEIWAADLKLRGLRRICSTRSKTPDVMTKSPAPQRSPSPRPGSHGRQPKIPQSAPHPSIT
jgi:tetratricopeptide (TPR) repeat protein